MRRLWFVLSFFLALGLLFPVSTTVDSWNEGNRYFARGILDTRTWTSEAWSILEDFANYNQWAPRFLDGNDPDSVDDWVHFKGFHFQDPDLMILEYDLNRGWPMNQKGNQATFHITRGPGTIEMRLTRGFFGIYDGGLTLVSSAESGTQFQIDMHLWGIIAVFMDDHIFQSFLEEKVQKMAENLVYQAQTLGYTTDL